MASTRSRGRAGEALAAAYLELLGWDIEARNLTLAGVEVDLVARDGDTRVVVEVKLRGRSDYGGAALAVDGAKRARLRRAVAALGAAAAVRIDVIAVEMVDGGAVLRHYRNAISDQG